MRAFAAPAMGLILSVASTGCMSDTGLRSTSAQDPVVAEDFGSFPIGEVWEEGAVLGGWLNEFDGYGSVAVREVDGSPALTAVPARADDPGMTHAALIRTTAEFGDTLDLQVRATTLAQVRTGSDPNPWETAWVAWSYTDAEHFYYVALKTNGWELGKRDPAYPGGQRFLADGRDVTFPVGTAAEVEILQDGAEMTVIVDGVALTTFEDTERPYLAGAVGLYTEDAAVAFDDVVITTP
mgnify:CR=1 FL=1